LTTSCSKVVKMSSKSWFWLAKLTKVRLLDPNYTFHKTLADLSKRPTRYLLLQ
jgi:hypothetical protein